MSSPSNSLHEIYLPSFIELLLNGGNVVANYLESIRLACNPETFNFGLRLLSTVAPYHPFPSFAAALFYAVSPLEGVAITAREEFWEVFPNLYFAEDVAAEVMIHIGELSTNDDLAFSNPWSNVYRPQCVDLCSLGNVCKECLFY
ncbi:unnamed protein product [Arabis nemorensis]|uniref:Uncharacterized protein n=1 Tax=Arabis nemorensis TaxID=586526 RepID=A0A565AYX5_9BRAS|nr:unnamed protein product [Arabis nemorensis]